MIRRTFDATFLNTVANHPEVRPWLGGEGAIDLSETINNADNFALICGHGGFVLRSLGGGVYEVHSQFLPDSGTAAIRAMRAALRWMFTRTDAVQIVSQVPDNNDAAKGFARAGGLKQIFRREHGLLGPASYVGIRIEDWAQGANELEAVGDEFHHLLETAKIESGSSLPQHPDDPAHERAVGAAVEMCRAGNSAKGVAFYNQWALLAGYMPIRLVSVAPLVIDVVDAVVGLENGKMEVLLCR